MKTSLELDGQEITQAVAEYVSRKTGMGGTVSVRLYSQPDYDFADRPTGTHTFSAVATFEKAVEESR